MLTIFALPVLAGSRVCETDRVDEIVKVKKVVDGDTVHLVDGRKLRFIGINTPELARKGKSAEPLAHAARQFVRDKLRTRGPLQLRYDRQRKDRYGRTLAHVFLNDGNSLSALLAQQGYGHAVAIAPNGWNVNCYFAAEYTARNTRTGIWRQSRFQAHDANTLKRSTQGFYLIKGRVSRVGNSRKAYWLQLDKKGAPPVAIRIPKKYARTFDHDIKALAGSHIEARGWLRLIKNELRMNVSHNAMLTVTDD